MPHPEAVQPLAAACAAQRREIAGCKAKSFCYMPKYATTGRWNHRTTVAMPKLTECNEGVGIVPCPVELK
jgi:hypothetical protein